MERRKVKVADAGGDTISLVHFDVGRPLCTLMEHIDFNAIKAAHVRDDDVILCTYPRTGTHWVWELMRMIMNGKTDNDPVEKEATMFEFLSHGELDSLPSPRVLNSHLWFQQFPAEVTVTKPKLVLLYRDPKDVAVSFYHLHRTGPWYEYKGQFGNWITLFMEGKVDWGSYGEYLREWERVLEQHPEIPVHVMAYEQLKKNPLEELARLSEFLGKDYDVSFLQSVYDACAIDKMRERKGQHWDGKVADSANFMYRQGRSGGWKDWFTVAMNERFDLHWSKIMDGSKLFSLQ